MHFSRVFYTLRLGGMIFILKQYPTRYKEFVSWIFRSIFIDSKLLSDPVILIYESENIILTSKGSTA